VIDDNKYPNIFTYINIRLIQLHFLLRKNIINHKDINLISSFNHSTMCFVINVYSDDQQSALKYLKDIEINLNNILIITGNFNIRDNDWNPLYPHHSTYADTFREIADFFNLELLMLIIQVPT